MAQVTGYGTPMETSGNLPRVGETAPRFRLVGSDLGDVGLDDFKGKK